MPASPPKERCPSADHGRAPEEARYARIVWQQLRKRRLAMAAAWGLVGLLVLAICAPVVASNRPLYWRVTGGDPSSPWLRSLFDRNFFESPLDLFFNTLLVVGTPLLGLWAAVSRWTRKVGAGLRRRVQRWSAIGAVGILFAALVAILASSRAEPKKVYPRLEEHLESRGTAVTAIYPPIPHSFRDVDLRHVREGSSWRHLLGTDNAGRDVLTRLIYGTRISLTIGLFAVAIYMLIGIVMGALAGYFGGRVDAIILRFIEVVISIPSLFLILTVAAFIERRSIFHIMLIIAAVSWTGPARLVRGEFLRLRSLDFVIAARAVGFSQRRIIFQEILPNALGPVLVSATFGVAAAILIESTMSFLGLGDITVPSWGQILNTGRTTGSWQLILAPGLAIFLTVSLLNLLGEGLRDALDPKLRS